MLLGVAVLLSVLAIQSRLGVIVVVALAFVAGCIAFTLSRGFAFIEVVAFLIHFDGLGFSEFTLGRLVAFMAMVVMAYKLMVEKWRPPAIPARHWLPPLALITWGVASAAWGSEMGEWLLGLGTLSLAFGYFAVSGFMVDSLEKIEKYLRAYWYGGIFGAVMGIWGLILGVRAFGFNADSNLFGVLAASMIPLTFYYRRNATTSQQKFIYTVVIFVVLAGAAGAGSRSGVIGASLCLFGSLVYRPGVPTAKRLLTAIPAALFTAVIALILIVVNPNTVERGTDSSGRLDFWLVIVNLIEEDPIQGQGLGQLAGQVTPELVTTPGAVKLTDHRDEVAAHNAWLDVTADLGFIGLAMWTTIIVVTVMGLLRPKWKNTKELSGYLLLMFLPVLTGSLFLTLLNNKLAWSIIGLSAALQVPSWGTRYKGYFAPRGSQLTAGQTPGTLARWDLKISQRFRVWVLLGALGGAVLFGVIGAAATTPHHVATMSIVAPKLDIPPSLPRVPVAFERLQVLHNLILSDAYAAELQALSGLDRPIEAVGAGVGVIRPKAGPYLEIDYTDVDEQNVQAVGPHLIEALDNLIEKGHLITEDALADEVRPRNPGEQNYYTGPMFLPVSDETHYRRDDPNVVWMVLVGSVAGAMTALAMALLQQRRPRVNNADDMPHAVGMPLWTHVGRNGRRNASTADQFAQVAVTAFEATESEQWPRRMLVAAPEYNRSSVMLAAGVAASLAASGQRVVLVDGQVERPMLSWRLGAGLRPGINDVAHGRASLGTVLRRVRRWTLPRSVRKACGEHVDNIRFVAAGRPRRGEPPLVAPEALASLDADVVTIMLGPPLLGTVPVSPSLQWADVVLYNLIEGETLTFDAEDAALQISTFARGPSGVVLSDV